MPPRTKTAEAATLDASMRIVLLRGPERFLRDEYTRRLTTALVAAYGEIDQFAFDGASTEPAAVLDELRSYGLLQQHKLVIVDQADKLIAAPPGESDAAPAPRPKRGKGRGRAPARRTPRALLEKYADEPVESATLLLRSDTWRPGRLDKAIEKVGAAIHCEAPPEGKAVGWCVARCGRAHDCTIDREAAALLVERIGPDLTRLDNELAKLAAFVSNAAGPDGPAEAPAIGADDVRSMVGLSREEQAWAIQTELLHGGPAGAVAKLRELRHVSQQPDQLIIWSMTDLLRKLHAAAALAAQGMPDAAIAKELRLWGAARGPVLDTARRIPEERLARLFGNAVASDLRVKRGLRSGPRTLEALAVEIADTLR